MGRTLGTNSANTFMALLFFLFAFLALSHLEAHSVPIQLNQDKAHE